jgi:uncharacterized protein (TIGR04255 family)
MSNQLPTKLKKEPIIDSVFEIRFSSEVPMSSILPGILFNKLDGEKIIEQQPASQLPKQLRDSDPNLQFAPLICIQWQQYRILIGDRNVAIACTMPYPGWTKFNGAIIQVTSILSSVGAIKSIQRYSLKCVNIIPFSTLKEQVSSVNLSIKLGDHRLEKEVFTFRIEIPQDEFINVVKILSSAVVTAPDKTTKQGLIVDIDTIRETNNQSFNDFISGLENNLKIIHLKNKQTFFQWCITPQTLAYLEPTYE